MWNSLKKKGDLENAWICLYKKLFDKIFEYVRIKNVTKTNVWMNVWILEYIRILEGGAYLYILE